MANPALKKLKIPALLLCHHVLKTLYVFILFSCSLLNLTSAKSKTYNVVDYGADPTGQMDSTLAFLSVWKEACDSFRPAGIRVPRGRFLLGRAVRFSGQCNNKGISIKIKGTLVAPSDYRVIGDQLYWLTFERVSGVKIHGGVLDGQGTSLWDCKSSGQICPVGASTLGIINSDHVAIAGMTSLNSQIFHMIVNGSNNVKMHGVTIMAPGNSPNTDGIHVQFSSDVTILKPRIRTGDDCISVGPGTRNLWIENVACGPGHGISIGSLGWEINEDGVRNVTVRSATFSKTQNGFRIKSWARPSNGFVDDVHFEHAHMSDVQNPIVIDQNYCPYVRDCPHDVSGIKISGVSYKNIHGTSATRVAVRFDCSSRNPCSGISLEDVSLTYKNQIPQASCNFADGTALGTVQPHSCL